MKLKSLYRNLLVAAVLLTAAAGCKKDPNNPWKEYAPNMYLPVGYEPYKQEKANPINPQGLTMRLPVAGTVARRNYTTSFGQSDSAVVDLMVYNIPADSIEIAEKVLKNPVPLNEKTMAEGKVLYDRYCQHCHGAPGSPWISQHAGKTRNLALPSLPPGNFTPQHPSQPRPTTKGAD